MKKRTFATLAAAAMMAASSLAPAADAPAKKLYSGKPLKALLITGGCCHNYLFQSAALTAAVEAHADIEWTIVNDGGNGTRAQIDLYKDPDWAKGYDVVVHNECFAATTDPDYIKSITDAHKAGVPAVVIHCAMHTYRDAKVDEWRKFLGVTSRRHDHKAEYPVKVTAAEHPIMKGFPSDWVTPKDELYIIEKTWPSATTLATSVSERDKKEHPVIWVNDFGGTRIAGTTYGHSDNTFRDQVFLDLLARATLWAAGKL